MKKLQLNLCVLIALLSVCCIAHAQDIRLYDLRCNGIINPIGIDDAHPALSWKIASSARGEKQTAYQIVVSLTENDTERAPVWNSGKVMSEQSVLVPCGGPVLENGKRYFWKVKVWDRNGKESPYSVAQFWEMTVNTQHFTAEWISAPAVFDFQKLNRHRYAMIKGETHDFLEPMPLLRKKFDLKQNIAKATVYVAAPGFFELFINGKKVSDDILNPAFTNYDKTVLFSTYDVTSFLKSGANAMGVMLGNGWYNSTSKEVWGFDKAPWRNLPALKLQLEITYDNAEKQIVSTDTHWLATTGPTLFTALRQGEYYDARLEVPRWSEAEADEKNWQPVRRVAGPIGTLRPQKQPPVQVTQVLDAVNSQRLANGHIVYDFGQNMAGFVSLNVAGKAGSRLQFKYAEMVDANGAADQSNINNLLADSLFQVDRYTLKGGGDEQWSPRFVYHGFRYVEVWADGELPQLKSIQAKAVSTAFESVGEFTCSSEIVNKIQQATRWSYRNNFVGFPTDCPQREKNGWTGDAQLACEGGLTNFNAITAYQKWLGDIREEQQPNGSLPGIIPTPGWGYYWGNGPAWDIACIVIPWTTYQYTGDRRILQDNFTTMKKYVDYVHTRSPDYIADFGLGDWIPVETETPVGVTSTGYFYYGAATVAKAAGLLGNAADQQAYQALAAKIKEAFHKKYYNPKTQTYANGSQTALSAALFHGLVPDNLVNAIRKKLVQAVHVKNDHIDTGILGARYLPHALTDASEANLALNVITQTTYPSWGYWLAKGATTQWEDWKGEWSLNHIMFGDMSSWFYKALAGIRPDDNVPGFKHFIIKTESTETLQWAKGKYESAYGTLSSEWKNENGMFVHDIEVPVNTTATYYAPTGKATNLKESGKTIASQGIRIAGTEKGRVVLELEPGKYHFEMPLK
jgi:alpha-L-rhamnosidase